MALAIQHWQIRYGIETADVIRSVRQTQVRQLRFSFFALWEKLWRVVFLAVRISLEHLNLFRWILLGYPLFWCFIKFKMFVLIWRWVISGLWNVWKHCWQFQAVFPCEWLRVSPVLLGGWRLKRTLLLFRIWRIPIF